MDIDILEDSIYVFNSVLPFEFSRKLSERAIYLCEREGITRRGKASRGGESFYRILDGYVVNKYFPEIMAWYGSMVVTAQLIWNEDVIVSPYKQSSVNIKVYHNEKCSHGWHKDTNPISVLLYLSDNIGGTKFRIKQDQEVCVEAKAGRVVMFRGKNIIHGVPQAEKGRVVVTANLYLKGDIDRPSWIDELEYSNVAPPSPEDLD